MTNCQYYSDNLWGECNPAVIITTYIDRADHSCDTWWPSHEAYFDRIQNSMKIQNALVSNILDRSQRYFAHVTTVTLSWRVQNMVVIGRVFLTPECFNFHRISNSIEICLVGRAHGLKTSWHGNTFHITGHLWGESIGHWWIPHFYKGPVRWCVDVFIAINPNYLHQPWLWFITAGYLVKRRFLPAATRARGQSNDLNKEILASNLFNCCKEVINAPPVPSISRCIHIVYQHKNVWEYQWSNFIHNCMSTFLLYVHCKDALLDCSTPGERCESLTGVDEIIQQTVMLMVIWDTTELMWHQCNEYNKLSVI